MATGQDTEHTSRRPLRASRLAADYAAISAVLQQSARGRWFLAEFSRRNRSADTEIVLQAILRIEAVIAGGEAERMAKRRDGSADPEALVTRSPDAPAPFRLPRMTEIKDRLLRAREEIENMGSASEQAVADILAAAEAIQDLSWEMREKGLPVELSERLELRIADIYAACAFQDISGQRSEKIIQLLRLAEQRLNAEAEEPIGGSSGMAAEARPLRTRRSDLGQGVVDRLMGERRAPQDAADVSAPSAEDRLSILAARVEEGIRALSELSGDEDPVFQPRRPAPGRNAFRNGGREWPFSEAASPERQATEPAEQAPLARPAPSEPVPSPQEERREPQLGETGFEGPDSVALSRLHAAKRAALFG